GPGHVPRAGPAGRAGRPGGVGRRVAVPGRPAGRGTGRAPAREAPDRTGRRPRPTARAGAAPGHDPDRDRLLHDEVARLPEKYQAAVLTCFFEGLSHAEAARRLGWPAGTVAGRLARAKAILARRLSARGVGLAGLALPVVGG